MFKNFFKKKDIEIVIKKFTKKEHKEMEEIFKEYSYELNSYFFDWAEIEQDITIVSELKTEILQHYKKHEGRQFFLLLKCINFLQNQIFLEEEGEIVDYE